VIFVDRKPCWLLVFLTNKLIVYESSPFGEACQPWADAPVWGTPMGSNDSLLKKDNRTRKFSS